MGRKRKTQPPSSPKYRSRSPLPRKTGKRDEPLDSPNTKEKARPTSHQNKTENDKPTSVDTDQESISEISDLSSSTSDISKIGNQTSEIKTTKPSHRIPPIFIQTSPEISWRELAKVLYETPNLDPVIAKTTSTPFQIQINCPNENSFRIVQEFMTYNKINYHTFALPEEKSLKIAIKGIPLDITNEEIMAELQRIGFKPKFVRAFEKNGKRLPIHMVSLNRTENVKEIYEVSDLFYIRIKIEPYKSTGPAQCFSCQRFGHSSLQCGYPPRCVKGGANHSNKDCQKPKVDDPTCCNCKGKHTANYRGCPFYTKIITEKIEKSRDTNTRTILKATPPTTLTQTPTTKIQDIATTTISYAKATSKQTEKPEPTINALTLLRILNDLLTTAQKCVDATSKDAVISTALKIINAIPTIHNE
ncbi:unnamed protein product [Macrosiphum euphorbiae]|uniref:Pre-C2HC domain-containing protein n=1 Tax=Macrosiphum euphorbiae TaxID=13131 RepID=A0AAV0XPD0_9HEMI|nr:unnamed protein product [Macrosiphum euphorbiae]